MYCIPSVLPRDPKLPDWLIDGTYVRLCDGNNTFPELELHIYLDSLASLFTLSFVEDKIIIKYRQLNLDLAEYIGRSGRAYLAFALGDIMRGSTNSLINLVYFKNNNVLPFLFKDKLYLTTDAYPYIEYDTKNEKEHSVFFNEYFNAEHIFCCAHPVVEKDVVYAISYRENILQGNTVIVVYETRNMSDRRIVGVIPATQNHYIHQIMRAGDYIVVPLQPFIMSTLGFLIRDPLNESTKSLKLALIHIPTGKVIYYQTELKISMFHFINTYFIGPVLHVYLVGYQTSNIFELFNLTKFSQFNLPTGLFHISVNTDTSMVYIDRLMRNIELPTLNNDYLAKRNHYAYFAYYPLNGIYVIKYDFMTNTHTIWAPDDSFDIPTEAVFVPRPGAELEDDGIVMTNIYSNKLDLSYMIFLNARDMTEITRFLLAGKVPMATHARYFKNYLP